MKKSILLLFVSCSTFVAIAQSDTASAPTIFGKITTEMKDFKPDTSAVPNDKTTQIITRLRELKGGFNINEVILYKLEEDKQKKDITPEQYEKAKAYFQSGSGKHQLENAVTWIYRRHFTYAELKGLVKFYKTSAGQKMAETTPFVILQSLAAAEMIKNSIPK